MIIISGAVIIISGVVIIISGFRVIISGVVIIISGVLNIALRLPDRNSPVYTDLSFPVRVPVPCGRSL